MAFKIFCFLSVYFYLSASLPFISYSRLNTNCFFYVMKIVCTSQEIRIEIDEIEKSNSKRKNDSNLQLDSFQNIH